MNIGLIGPGEIGAVIVKKLRDAGYPVKMANSKGPDSLRELAAKTGAIPVSVKEVVQDVDILFLVLPQKAFPVLPKGLLNKAKKETIVIDVGNYYSWRDGRIDEIESGLTDSAWVALETPFEEGQEKGYRHLERPLRLKPVLLPFSRRGFSVRLGPVHLPFSLDNLHLLIS